MYSPTHPKIISLFDRLKLLFVKRKKYINCEEGVVLHYKELNGGWYFLKEEKINPIRIQPNEDSISYEIRKALYTPVKELGKPPKD